MSGELPSNVDVVLRCDAGGTTGVGHAVRCLALAQELIGRGLRVGLMGRVEVGWVATSFAAEGIDIVPAEPDPRAFTRQVRDTGATRCVLDGYEISPDVGAHLREAGVRVLTVVDGGFGAAQRADVYLDQNVGAVAAQGIPEGARQLVGPHYVLLRDSVLEARQVTRGPSHAPPRVLAVFGGTDPYGAAGVVTPLLLGSGRALDLTVVVADAAAERELSAVPVPAGSGLHVRGPVPDLPRLATEQDLVVTASGSTVWELLCVGVATALVCVTDNQQMGYRAAVDAGLCVGVGRLADLRERPELPRAVLDLLDSPAWRDDLVDAGRRTVDGRGRARVADELMA